MCGASRSPLSAASRAIAHPQSDPAERRRRRSYASRAALFFARRSAARAFDRTTIFESVPLSIPMDSPALLLPRELLPPRELLLPRELLPPLEPPLPVPELEPDELRSLSTARKRAAFI